MGAIAESTGIQPWGFHGLLMRIPMRNRTASPSTCAVWRPGRIEVSGVFYTN